MASEGLNRTAIREILGEAYTDDIAGKLISQHRAVVDRIRDELDSANQNAGKYKADAEKLADVQKELDTLKKDDWKTKYENEKKAYEDYKAQITRDAETAKKKAAYRKLLTEEKISEKALESVLNATDYEKIKLTEDGSLDGIDALRKEIGEKWGGFKSTTRQRGEHVDNPPAGAPGGSDSSVREYVRKLHDARYGAAPQQN